MNDDDNEMSVDDAATRVFFFQGVALLPFTWDRQAHFERLARRNSRLFNTCLLIFICKSADDDLDATLYSDGQESFTKRLGEFSTTNKLFVGSKRAKAAEKIAGEILASVEVSETEPDLPHSASAGPPGPKS